MQPKIYAFEDHKISPDKIDAHAYYVIQKLRENGFTAYLVGGSVRDLLMGQIPKDFDISTSARPEEIKSLFRNCLLIGRRFRLAHVRFGKKILEVATFRSGDIENSDLIVRDNDFGTEEQDVLRRDFTINGLLYDPEKQIILDYVGGYLDAKEKVLRTIGQAKVRFKQDPVRMIRLIKFQARFPLSIEPEALQALHECKKDIVLSSQARIFEELLRMLESGSSKAFFQGLYEKGLLELLLPKLATYFSQKQEASNQVLQLLQEIDTQTTPEGLDRPLLASCLVYPLFENHILSVKKERPLHLGEIAENAKEIIEQIFLPFFHLSRRMKGTMIFVMTSQFRLSTLPDTPRRRLRIPRDQSFPMALHFFKIRAGLHPDLSNTYELWKEEWEKRKSSFLIKKESYDPKRYSGRKNRRRK